MFLRFVGSSSFVLIEYAEFNCNKYSYSVFSSPSRSQLNARYSFIFYLLSFIFYLLSFNLSRYMVMVVQSFNYFHFNRGSVIV